MSEIASEAVASTPWFLLADRPSGLFETVGKICPGNGTLGEEAVWAYIQETASRYPGLPILILVASHKEELGACRVEVRAFANYRVSNGGATSVQQTDSKVAFLPSNNPRRALRTAPALTYIQAHYATTLILSAVAAACHMRPGQLSKTFKKEHGVSFKRFLLNYRLDRSAEMLKQMTCVKEAACSSGFTDLSYFARAFRGRFKITPTKFKEMHMIRRSLGG